MASLYLLPFLGIDMLQTFDFLSMVVSLQSIVYMYVVRSRNPNGIFPALSGKLHNILRSASISTLCFLYSCGGIHETKLNLFKLIAIWICLEQHFTDGCHS